MKWWHPAWVLLTAWGAEPVRQRGQRRLPDAEAAKHQRQLAYAHMWMLSGAGGGVLLVAVLLLGEVPAAAFVLLGLLPCVWPCTFLGLMALGLGRRPPSEMRRRAAAGSVIGVLGGLMLGVVGLSLD